MGSVYPPLSRMRELSLSVATSVANASYTSGITSSPRPKDVREHLADLMHQPYYSKLNSVLNMKAPTPMKIQETKTFILSGFT